MEIKFSLDAWEQYIGWQTQDKKTIKRINELLEDIMQDNPFEGIGKPEALKGNLSGFWSRRIDEHNRLVYPPPLRGNREKFVRCPNAKAIMPNEPG